MAEVPGEAAMLIETQNPAEIADAIATLIENPQLRISLWNSQLNERSNLIPKRMAELTYASYQRALNAA